MKWYVYFNFPYPEQLGNGYDSLAEAIRAVQVNRISYWNVEIESSSFGLGGCHRVVWNSNRGAWVNKRNQYSTIEQEGWV